MKKTPWSNHSTEPDGQSTALSLASNKIFLQSKTNKGLFILLYQLSFLHYLVHRHNVFRTEAIMHWKHRYEHQCRSCTHSRALLLEYPRSQSPTFRFLTVGAGVIFRLMISQGKPPKNCVYSVPSSINRTLNPVADAMETAQQMKSMSTKDIDNSILWHIPRM